MLKNITNYVFTLDSILGRTDEKAVVTNMGICHGCLTYSGVTRGVRHSFCWPGRSDSYKYFQVDMYE